MSDGAIKYVGVDGCKAGWIGVGLDDGDGWKVKVCGKFADLLVHFGDARIVLVDVPIGLSKIEYDKTCNKRRVPCCEIARACDKAARSLLGSPRSSSVFTTPPRPFVKKAMGNPDWGYHEANEWLKKQLGCKRGITQQAFNITRKIGEVDEYLKGCVSDSPTIWESHPEVCFWALGKKQRPMSHKKSDREGIDERLETLRHSAQYVNDIKVDGVFKRARREYTKSQVADDDILDALALAITAKIVWQNCDRLGTLPERCDDGRPKENDKCKPKLPMEMVYAILDNPNQSGV